MQLGPKPRKAVGNLGPFLISFAASSPDSEPARLEPAMSVLSLNDSPDCRASTASAFDSRDDFPFGKELESSNAAGQPSEAPE